MVGSASRFTGNGLIQAGTVVIYAIILTPAAAAATVDIQDNGVTVLSLSAPANGPSTVVPLPEGLTIKDPTLANLVGASASVSVVK